MTIREMQDRILKLKREKDFCILAHSYIKREIIEIADIVGDSFKLSQDVCSAPQKNILFCGVHFMAETAKMLNMDKKVYLANGLAGCPMAEQMDPAMLKYMKEKEPDRKVVAYINTTAALKTYCDVCVTSSSAVRIVKKTEGDKLLFIPDCNLGAYVKEQVPEKDIKLVQGGCPIHASVTGEEAAEAKKRHPKALLLVHPECVPAVVEQADYVGSTSGIIAFAKSSDNKQFIIGTELEIAETLQYECPDKEFFPLSKKLICPNMKITTLVDVLNTLEAPEKGFEIKMTQAEAEQAKKCIDEMLRLG
ncbi:MAG: quinolinate synthase NadA [Firmicutes bacterium]|nr:quinolinate synthase NadA [[Eubacterium] siraeum]MCM1487541.1 quinolinate synthase NadA [Bacillota bacterium]